MSEMIEALATLFKVLGDNPQLAGGWVVALIIFVFMIWRISILDKYINKFADLVEEQEKEWRAVTSKTDAIMLDMLKQTTNSMTALAEKMNTLQMILLQSSKGAK